VVEGRTQGEVERFQQTMKHWLRSTGCAPNRTSPPPSPSFNTCLTCSPRSTTSTAPPVPGRPHDPHGAYQARPKATPTSSRDTDTHDRIRHDRIDQSGAVTLRVNGRLHHIGIGRAHARTRVLLLVHDLHVRVVHAATGELLRELTIDPTRDYQPTGRRRSPPRQ
jgi:hypothetical protein